MTPSPIESDELLELLTALVDGRLDLPEQERLERVLAEEPAARAVYVQFMKMHALLARNLVAPLDLEVGATTRDTALPESSSPQVVPLSVWRRGFEYLSHPVHFSYFVATIALVSFLLTAAQIYLPRQADAPPVVAQPPAVEEPPHVASVIADADCRWSAARPAPTGELRPGEVLELERGLATIRFAAGAEVVLIGPARMRLESEMRATLAQGTMTARVPPQAVGFTVQTPWAAVVDLGTEFGVRVDDEGEGEVQVFSGRVAVYPLADGELRERQVVQSQEGVQFNRRMGWKRLTGVDLSGFLRKSPDLQTEPVALENPSFESPELIERYQTMPVPGWATRESFANRSGLSNSRHLSTATPQPVDGQQWLHLNHDVAVEQAVAPIEPGTTYLLVATVGRAFNMSPLREYEVSFRIGDTSDGPSEPLKTLAAPPVLAPGTSEEVRLLCTPSAADVAQQRWLFISFAAVSGSSQLLVDAVRLYKLVTPAAEAPADEAQGSPPRDAAAFSTNTNTNSR